MTQIDEFTPPQTIIAQGIEWRIRKDATDPTANFDHSRVDWLNTGCEKKGVGIYACWILGLVPPDMGTIEKPLAVMYIGFTPERINMLRNTLTINDLNCMNIYSSDASTLISDFVDSYLHIDKPSSSIDNKVSITPYPALEELDVKSDSKSQ